MTSWRMEDFPPYDLLLPKLNSYQFNYKSIKRISSFPATKINSSFSSCEDLHIGVAQGSILGHLLFDIYMCNIYLFMSESQLATYGRRRIYLMCRKNENLDLLNFSVVS